jgi:DNA polymerase-3 subunit beta
VEGTFGETLIPKQSVLELIKNISKYNGKIDIDISDKLINFSSHEVDNTKWVFKTKLVNGQFPDYKRVIPVDNDKIATFDSQAMLNAIERISPIISANNVNKGIKFIISPNNVNISAKSDTGAGNESLDIEYDGPEIIICYNMNYISSVLSNLKNQKCSIKLKDSNSPAMVYSGEDHSTHYHILMPMRA